MDGVVDWQCTARCHSQEHGTEMAAVITCGTVHQIKTFILSRCLNPFFVSDGNGRNLLHVAASCGKLEILEWLLAKGAECRVKDKESGWTPLHRSLFYGQISCAIHLIRHGASLRRYDKDDLTPLELVMKDKPAYVAFDPKDPTQAYSWGTNANFNLGHGRQRSRDQPELVDSLASGNHSIKQVVMCKFHTLFLTHQGRVLTCGHGQGGRLGLGDETTCLRPQLVKSLGARCKMIAGARDHSLFLMDSGNVMSCGENAYLQLGHSSIGQKCLVPKSLASKTLKNKEVIGIAAGRFHTVVYTRDAVYTLGLNAGQLGHNKSEEPHISLRQVTSLSHPNIIIKDVVTSDAATVCLTRDGDIYVLQDYQCRKVASNHLSVKQLAVIGGHLNAELADNVLEKQGGDELQLLALHFNGRVSSWGKSENSWKRCVWSHRRPLTMTQMAFSQHNMAFVTAEGEGFLGRFISTKKSQADPSSKSTIDKGSRDGKEGKGEQPVSLERLPVIHRATGVACDPKGNNFIVLQSDPRTSLTELPEVGASEMESHFTQLMVEADSTDMIHDVLIKIDNHRLAAHKYILASGSDYFRKIFTPKSEDDSVSPTDEGKAINKPDVIDDEGTAVIDLSDVVNYDIFCILVQYVYTGMCDIFRPGFNLQVTPAKQKTGSESRSIDCDPISDETLYSMGELTINERNRHQSAYSVHREQGQGKTTKDGGDGNKKGKKGKRKGNREQSDQPKGQKQGPLLAVKMVIDEAKKFGIKALAKRLETVKCVDGTLVNFGPATAPLSFDPTGMQHLSDVVLKSDEGTLFPCHKCVLTARLDYFQSMLGCGWMEASTNEPLKMAMPASVLDLLLDYLYMDRAPRLNGCQDLELLCNTLTIADQLFVSRLKDICELVLADLVNLRNVSELLQFASVYQALQLKATCHQYISLNLACLVESGSLDLLEDEVLEELSIAYKATLPYSRFIKPSLEAPDLSHIVPYPPEENGLLANTQDTALSLPPRTSSSTTSISDFEALARKAKAKRKGRRRTSSTGKHANPTVSESGEDLRVSCSEEIKATSPSPSNSGFNFGPISSRSSSSIDVVSSTSDLRSTTPVESEETLVQEETCSVSPERGFGMFVLERKNKKEEKEKGKEKKKTREAKMSDGETNSGVMVPLSLKVQQSVGESQGEQGVAKSWSWASPKGPVTGLRDIMQLQSSTNNRNQQQSPQPIGGITSPTAPRSGTAPPPKHATIPHSGMAPPRNHPTTPRSGTPPAPPPAHPAKSPLVSPTVQKPLLSSSARGPTPTGKKSQKQRKREMQAALAGAGGVEDKIKSGGEGDKTTGSPMACPWAKVTSPRSSQVSFRDLQAEDEQVESIWGPSPTAQREPERTAFSAARKISFGLATHSSQRSHETDKSTTSGPASPESPKEVINPWQRSDAVSPPARQSVSFSDIVRAESEEKDNLDRARNKSLSQIQIEERAMEELMAQYRGFAKPDEYVTVERVQLVMAIPLWKKKADGS